LISAAIVLKSCARRRPRSARAKLYNLRWHSFRHTFAAWAVQAVVRLERLMELGGWRSYKSVLRYKHLAPDHLRQDAELVAGDRPMLTDSRYVVRRRKAADSRS
jgi:integrase